MIWRDAIEKPRVSGKYRVLIEGLYLPVPFNGHVNRATFSSWYSTNQDRWDDNARILAWLDPEVPEKYLPEKFWAPVNDFVTTEKPKGEWLPFATFKFDMSKYYWAKDGNQTWVVDGSGCISPNIDLGSQAYIWSIPIEEPPR